MNMAQSIYNPPAINVFGSTLIRIEPDIASLNFAVSHLAQHPTEAYREARNMTKKVLAYLEQAHITDVGYSHIFLHEERQHVNGEPRLAGYTAKVSFNVLLRDLDRVEEIISGVVDAGANEISDVEFQSSRLKEIRASARRNAVGAAFDKAKIYCDSALVKLGRVLYIKDVNPDQLRGFDEGHVNHKVALDDEKPLKAIDPGSIAVRAAVMISFEIEV